MKIEVTNNERTDTCGGSHQSPLRPDAQRRLQRAMSTSWPRKSSRPEVADHSPGSRLNGQQRNWGVPHDDRARLPGQKVSGGRAISEWFCLKSQAGVSNPLRVKKNQRFPNFLAAAVPLARGGLGDRRRQEMGSTTVCSGPLLGTSKNGWLDGTPVQCWIG